MEQLKELTIFSELSKVSIKNYHDKIVVNLLPHLEQIVETASAYVPSNTMTSSVIDRASEINESSSVVHLSYSNQLQHSGRTFTIKEPPLEIIIEQPLDERSLVNLSRLVGEHTPTSMSQEEAASLMALLEKNHVDHVKITSTGIRVIFRILEQTFRPLYRLPPQFEHFTGRNQELATLRERRNTVQVIAPRENLPEEEKHDKSVSQISGTGGIGKSQLANYYARLQFREKNYDWVIWMMGGEDHQRALNNLSSQFADLGLALGLDVKELKDEVLYQLIYERLSAKGRGLVVIDDAPNYAVVKPFLPEHFDQRNMDVLITTRNSQTFGTTLTKILLDVFTLGDAKRYICRILNDSIIEADSELLATTLDRYPLALTQALAYILNNQCTITAYCERYKTLRGAKKKYLETPVYEDDPYQLEHQQRKRDFEATMQVVVQLSLEQVKSICKTDDDYEQAKTVLMSAAYLAPEMGIPKKFMSDLLTEDQSQLKINKALVALCNLSLLTPEENKSYSIHKVIQDVLKNDESIKQIELRLMAWHGIIIRYDYLSSTLKISEFEKELIPHLDALIFQLGLQEQTKVIVAAIADIHSIASTLLLLLEENKTAKSHLERQLICFKRLSVAPETHAIGKCKLLLGCATCMEGDHQLGILLLEEALKILESTLNHQPNLIGTGKMHLGRALVETGKFEDAMNELEQAKEIFKAQSDVYQANVGICLQYIAIAQLHFRYHNSDLTILQESLAIIKNVYGDQHSYTGRCYLTIAQSLILCGKGNEAIEQLGIALPILSKALGDDHKDVGAYYMTLASASESIGNLPDAIKHYTKALNILTPKVDKQHKYMAKCLGGLGGAMISSGDQRGKEYLEMALPILKSNYGHQHRYVGLCLLSLGEVAQLDGDWLGAKSRFTEALPIFKMELGKYDAMVGRCLNNIGTATLSCGDSKTAIPFLKEGLEVLKSALGNVNEDVANSLFNLGKASMMIDEPQTAVAFHKQALEIYLVTKKKPERVGTCKMEMGMALFACGLQNEGGNLIEEALTCLTETVGCEHLDVGRCLMNLGTVKSHSHQHKKATKLFEKSLQILKNRLGDKHGEVGKCLGGSGVAIQMSGKPREAIEILNLAIPILKKEFGLIHPDIGNCLMTKGIATVDLNQPHEGKNLIEQSLEVLTSALGRQHLRVGRCLMNLGKIAIKCGDFQFARERIKEAIPILRSNIAGFNDATNCQMLLDDGFKYPSLIYSMSFTALLLRWETSDPAQAIRRSVVLGSDDDLEELLRSFHAFANIPDQIVSKGFTALHLAVIHHKPNCVGLLLERVGFSLIKDAQGCTALDYALQINSKLILGHFKKALLEYYSDHDIDEKHLTKLVRLCAHFGDVPGLKLLINLNVSVNEVENKSQLTALHYAVRSGNEECVKLLFASGANPESVDHDGHTPRFLANQWPSLASIFNSPAEITDELLMDKIADDVLAALSDIDLEDASVFTL